VVFTGPHALLHGPSHRRDSHGQGCPADAQTLPTYHPRPRSGRLTNSENRHEQKDTIRPGSGGMPPDGSRHKIQKFGPKVKIALTHIILEPCGSGEGYDIGSISYSLAFLYP
jgi:hypothetical protein